MCSLATTGRSGVRTALTALNAPLARRRLLGAIEAGTPPWRVELGAHRQTHAGWLPTDVSWRARHYLDATAPWPFPPASVQYVFGDNMIEHVALDGARALFRHARRAICAGGRLRLATPDVEATARAYIGRGDALHRVQERHRRAGYRMDHDVDVLRAVFTEHGHHRGYLWDFRALSDELQRAGFVEVRRCLAGESDDPVLRGLESRTSPVDRELTLVVEACVPTR